MPDQVRQQEEQKTRMRAQVLGMAYTDTSAIEKQLYREILNIDELKSLRIVPLVADKAYIHFGITTTTSQQTISQLRQRFTDQRLDFSIISDSGFNEFMLLYDPPPKVEYADIEITRDSTTKDNPTVQMSLEQVKPDDMLAYLVQQAYKLKASDIHLESQKENVRVRLRIDGVLHPVATLSKDKFRHLSSVIAAAANIYADAKDAQTGHISRSYRLSTGEEVTLNLRVETIPSFFGMDAVMRLFNMRLDMFNLERLGLSSKESEVVDSIIQNPSGMVLVVGPTGSGKTTTLYSLINTLNSPERKIITLEDPVEYNMPGVVQVPVSGAVGTANFAEKLRSVLRLDPDVVMVGEIRDEDTAKTALQGALTGHLVLSTFHASSAAAALTRLIDMAGSNPLLPSAIRLIMAQRLVRRLDDQTKQSYQPDEELKNKLAEYILAFPPGVDKPDVNNLTLFRPGKSQDHPFGFNGQLALREQLLMTPAIQQLLRQPKEKVTTDALQAEAVEEGMLTMLQDGIIKAVAGLTSIEEVFRVVDHP